MTYPHRLTVRLIHTLSDSCVDEWDVTAFTGDQTANFARYLEATCPPDCHVETPEDQQGSAA